MQADIERKTQVIYDVYDYTRKYDSFDTLKEAREAFRPIKAARLGGSIVKRVYEHIQITTETVVQYSG